MAGRKESDFLNDSDRTHHLSPWLVWRTTDSAGSSEARHCACVMTFFNQFKFFPAALGSILENFLPATVIVIDDNSTPCESDLAAEYCAERTVRYLRLERNLGPAGARMAGARLVDAEFLMFMDSDDVIAADYLALLTSALRQDTDAAFAMGVQRFFENDFLDSPVAWPASAKTLAETLEEPCLAASGVLFRKSIFDQIGGFRQRMRGGFEDWDLGLRLAAEGFRGVVCQRAVYHYRRCAGSQMSSIDPVKRAAIDCVLWVNNREFVRAVSGDLGFLGRRWWPIVAGSIRRGNIRLLLVLFREAFARAGISFLLSGPSQFVMFIRWLLGRRAAL